MVPMLVSIVAVFVMPSVPPVVDRSKIAP